MTDEEREVWDRHFERLQRMLADGTLILAGPTLGRVNTGIAVIEAPDEDAAQKADGRGPGDRERLRARRAATVPRRPAPRTGLPTRPAGFEPATSASGGRALYPLSYGRLATQSSPGLRSLAQSRARAADTVWAVDLSVVFLGTGGSVPTARRATACVLARVGGDRILFDCGEGSQRQMQRSTGLVQLDEIYLTHYHADHYLGLPGLLKTYDLQARERPLRIVGPRGLRGLFSVARPHLRRLSYDVELVELDRGRRRAPRRVRGALLRGRPPDARPRIRAGRGRAARAVRPRGRRRGSAYGRAPTSAGCRTARRSRARTARRRPTRCSGTAAARAARSWSAATRLPAR